MKNNDAATLITGAGIPLYQLLVQRQAVKLEAKGMKLSRGPSATSRLAKAWGITRKQVPAELERRILLAGEKVGPGDFQSVPSK